MRVLGSELDTERIDSNVFNFSICPQVVNAKINIGYRYCTEWEMQQLQELSAEEESSARLQASINAMKAALMALGRDPLTSTPSLNLSNQEQTVFNSYAQHFAPTSASTTAQAWTMPEYMTPPQTALSYTLPQYQPVQPQYKLCLKHRCSEQHTEEG